MMPRARTGISDLTAARSSIGRRTIAALSAISGADEPPGGPPEGTPGEVIGIPDGSFGEEYGGLVRPERVGDGGAGAGGGGERVARNTAIVSLATGVSRVLGLGREIVAASFFGTHGPASAFTIAFQIPNLVSNLFANAALSAAFVPVFTDLLQQGRKREAFRLASTLFWIMLIVLGALTAFFVLAAGVIMPLFTGPTFESALDALTVGLSQVLFPVVLLIGLIGLLVGVLQSYEHFTIPAISPAVWNLVIIVLLVLLRPHFRRRRRRRRSAVRLAMALFFEQRLVDALAFVHRG